MVGQGARDCVGQSSVQGIQHLAYYSPFKMQTLVGYVVTNNVRLYFGQFCLYYHQKGVIVIVMLN